MADIETVQDVFLYRTPLNETSSSISIKSLLPLPRPRVRLQCMSIRPIQIFQHESGTTLQRRRSDNAQDRQLDDMAVVAEDRSDNVQPDDLAPLWARSGQDGPSCGGAVALKRICNGAQLTRSRNPNNFCATEHCDWFANVQ